jgi:hypothetical protein
VLYLTHCNRRGKETVLIIPHWSKYNLKHTNKKERRVLILQIWLERTCHLGTLKIHHRGLLSPSKAIFKYFTNRLKTLKTQLILKSNECACHRLPYTSISGGGGNGGYDGAGWGRTINLFMFNINLSTIVYWLGRLTTVGRQYTAPRYTAVLITSPVLLHAYVSCLTATFLAVTCRYRK